MERAKCYTCKYRGNVPGDAHSCCRYPGTDVGIFSFFEKANLELMEKLNIKADPHGIRNGWFLWPSNFDPVWLMNCDGYTAKED